MKKGIANSGKLSSPLNKFCMTTSAGSPFIQTATRPATTIAKAMGRPSAMVARKVNPRMVVIV